MTLYFETFSRQLHKFGEELCGDHVEIVRTPDNIILALADGLGSGVKANILSTLTTKIAASMLKEGVHFDEVISTMAETLPVCRQRGVAYSTLTICQVKSSGECYLAEFDSPETIFLRQGEVLPLPREERLVFDKVIFESHFTLQHGDTLLLLSDGVIHAGIGASLNMGWRLANVAAYVANLARKNVSLRSMVTSLANTCDQLYASRPGDDATIVGIRAAMPRHLVLLTGPPQNTALDEMVVDRFLSAAGLKVICGGTTAQMVARRLQVTVSTAINTMEEDLPPIATMPGIDLVTEGMLTLTAALAIVRAAALSPGQLAESKLQKNTDGASRLADLLLNQCTHVQLLVGCALNAAHVEHIAPQLGLRRQLIADLAHYLRLIGKEVVVEYF